MRSTQQCRKPIPSRWLQPLGCVSCVARSWRRLRFAPSHTALARYDQFGHDALAMFFTRDGLEQASRPEVADYHASRFVQAGVHSVVDIGCGIG